MLDNYLFHFRRVDRDRDSYYVTRWDLAIPVEVIATSEKEAYEKLWSLSKDLPNGRYWVAQLDKITAVCDVTTDITFRLQQMLNPNEEDQTDDSI